MGDATLAGALDHLAAGVVIVESDGRIVEMNRAAERIVQLGDGLMMREGRLGAARVFETAKLARLIADAAGTASRGCMAVGRHSARLPYLMALSPLGDSSAERRDRVAVLIADPECRPPAAGDLAELFGLSPAESRIAAALVMGDRPSEIAAKSGLRITTVRTHLRSILRKVGVDRQTDLMRIFTVTGLITSPPP